MSRRIDHRINNRIHRLGLLLLVLTWPSIVRGQSDQSSTPEKQQHKLTEKERELLKQINVERRRHDKPALESNETLNRVAHEFARQMAEQETLSHVLGESRPDTRLREAGYEHRGFAENIAYGYPTAEQVVEGWMESPGHRRNMLDEAGMGLREIGVGAYREPDGPWYYCAIFGRPVERPATRD